MLQRPDLPLLDRSIGLSRSAPWEDVAEAVGALGFDLPRSKSAKGRDVIARMTIDLVDTAKGRHGSDKYGNQRSGWTSCSLSRDWWHAASGDYAASVGYDTVRNAVSDLSESGLIAALEKGAQWTEGEARDYKQTRFLASPDLRKVRLPRTVVSQGFNIRMRTPDGGPAQVPRTRVVIRKSKFLDAFNESTQGLVLGLASPRTVDNGDGTLSFGVRGHCVWTDAMDLYRVYNGSFNFGGRFYGGWWQGVSKSDREWFTFDGVETCEEDHETLHPKLLRAVLGLPPPTAREYVIRGYEDDERLAKVAYLTLVNAPTREKALGAIAAAAQRIEDERYGVVRPAPEPGKRTPIEPLYWEMASCLIQAVKETYPDIDAAGGWHSGMGLTLMKHDADMAEAVMKKLISRGIRSLPIHDSFVVERKDRDTLVGFMQDVLRAKVSELFGGSVIDVPAARQSPTQQGIQATSSYTWGGDARGGAGDPTGGDAGQTLTTNRLMDIQSADEDDGQDGWEFLRSLSLSCSSSFPDLISLPSSGDNPPMETDTAMRSIHSIRLGDRTTQGPAGPQETTNNTGPDMIPTPTSEASGKAPAGAARDVPSSVTYLTAMFEFQTALVDFQTPQTDNSIVGGPAGPSGTTDSSLTYEERAGTLLARPTPPDVSPPALRSPVRRPSFARSQEERDRETIARLAAAPLSAASRRETMKRGRRGGTT